MSDLRSRDPENEIEHLAEVYRLSQALKNMQNGGRKYIPAIITIISVIIFSLIGVIYTHLSAEVEALNVSTQSVMLNSEKNRQQEQTINELRERINELRKELRNHETGRSHR